MQQFCVCEHRNDLPIRLSRRGMPQAHAFDIFRGQQNLPVWAEAQNRCRNSRHAELFFVLGKVINICLPCTVAYRQPAPIGTKNATGEVFFAFQYRFFASQFSQLPALFARHQHKLEAVIRDEVSKRALLVVAHDFCAITNIPDSEAVIACSRKKAGVILVKNDAAGLCLNRLANRLGCFRIVERYGFLWRYGHEQPIVQNAKIIGRLSKSDEIFLIGARFNIDFCNGFAIGLQCKQVSTCCISQ